MNKKQSIPVLTEVFNAARAALEEAENQLRLAVAEEGRQTVKGRRDAREKCLRQSLEQEYDVPVAKRELVWSKARGDRSYTEEMIRYWYREFAEVACNSVGQVP